MLKKYLGFLVLIVMMSVDCNADEQTTVLSSTANSSSEESSIFYDLETNRSFIVDFKQLKRGHFNGFAFRFLISRMVYPSNFLCMIGR